MVGPSKLCPICQSPEVATCDRAPGIPMSGASVCPHFDRHYQRTKYGRRWPVPAKYAHASLVDRPKGSTDPSIASAIESAATSLQSHLGACYSGRVGNVILAGVNGCGKTHLAAAAINRAGTHLGMSTAWTDAHGLIERIKATFADDCEETAGDIARELTRVDLLCVDDVGKQRGTEFSDAELWNLFNARYLENRPVIITTNLTAAELNRTPTWSAIIDRLMENALVLKFEGAKSIRQEMGKRRVLAATNREGR